jgi:hypothetical protein
MTTKTDKIYEDGLKRFDFVRSVEQDERYLATSDLIFINEEGGQWTSEAFAARQDRPRYTIDRISSAIDQITGDQRQTQTTIKVIPQTGADEKTAEVLTGLIRSIEQTSKAVNIYNAAFTEQVICGYGGWRILTDYESDNTFDQIIKMEPIQSAVSSLYFDPAAKESTKQDAKWAFLISSIPRDVFIEMYPKASIVDFSTDQYSTGRQRHWFTENSVQIAEYWYKVPGVKKLGLLTDGRVIDLKEEEAVLDELLEKGVAVIKEREVEIDNIEMVLMNGAELLTTPQKWAGKYIPLVPVFGRTAVVENKQYVRGVVRKAKDSQRIYNYASSAVIEAAALTPKDPIFITANQIKGYEDDYKNFPVRNNPFMLYVADPLAPGPPKRGGAPQLQTALLQQVEQAARDIHATTGLEPASLGNVPEMKSGKAIQAQQAMGDRGSYIFQDNLDRAKQHSGEIMVDLITKIYDSERVVKIIGLDEVTEDITINERQYNEVNEPIIDRETGKQVIVNDLSLGSCSVIVTSGPSFFTKRQETVNQLITLAGSSPVVQELALDLIIDNMDLNNGDEIKRRVRKRMIEQGLIEPTEEEREEFGLNKPPPTDPLNDELIKNLQAQTEKLLIGNEKIIAEIRNKDADTEAKIIGAQKTSVDALTATIEALLKKLDTGIVLSEKDVELVEGQQALVAETQIDVISGGELANSAPLGRPTGGSVGSVPPGSVPPGSVPPGSVPPGSVPPGGPGGGLAGTVPAEPLVG